MATAPNRPIDVSPPQMGPSGPTVSMPPPSGGGDLSLLRGPPMPPMGGIGDGSVAQFVNDLREVVPANLQKSSWAYSANLVGLAAYSPRLAEALRHRYREYIQYLKMSVPKRNLSPEFSLSLNNLRLLGTIQTARATRPDTERRLLGISTSEVLSSPVGGGRQRKKFLGILILFAFPAPTLGLAGIAVGLGIGLVAAALLTRKKFLGHKW